MLKSFPKPKHREGANMSALLTIKKSLSHCKITVRFDSSKHDGVCIPPDAMVDIKGVTFDVKEVELGEVESVVIEWKLKEC